MKLIFLLLGGAILIACTNNSKISNQSENVPTSISDNVIGDNKTFGIDISKYQGDEIDFLNRKKDTIQFVICKSTGGITYADPDFSSNWKKIVERGFIRGAYHFYYCNDDPKKQADNYLKVVGQLAKTDFPPIVDFEEAGLDKTQSIETIQNNLITFLDYIASKTGRLPIIYTDINTGNTYLDNAKFSKFSLWIANYTKGLEPNLPKAWRGTVWKLWQKSDNYELNSNANDLDVFNGNIDQLKAFIQSE
jgi:lysozyme